MTITERIKEKLQAGPLTKADLALDGVSQSTVDRAVSRLVFCGELRVAGTSSSVKRGKKPYLYAVRA